MVVLADMSLFLATPAQVQASRKRNYPHWGRGLSLDAYLRRADVLDVYEHAVDGNLMTWVLAPRSDPDTLDFVCACETFRRKAKVITPSASEPEDTFAYGIAAVFCPPQHRGRGYARHMMRLLHHVLAAPGLLPAFPLEWGDPPVPPSGAGNARFSALWSDIGWDFYTTCGPAPGFPGWLVRDPVGTIWPVDTGLSRDSVGPPGVQWLSEQDCLALWEEDAKHVEAELRAASPATTRCTFLPNYGLAAYQPRRSGFFLPGIPDTPLPETCGLCIPASGTYATYITDIRPNPLALLVTRLRVNPENLPELLAALMHAARAQGIKYVEVWNLSPDLVEAADALGAMTGLRIDHLPALAWYGPEDPADVKWMFNEKFCWC